MQQEQLPLLASMLQQLLAPLAPQPQNTAQVAAAVAPVVTSHKHPRWKRPNSDDY